MGFISSIFSAIIDVIVTIVEVVVQIVEMIVMLIMVLLGYDGGSSQTIEYFEVHNVPLFDDVDGKNPLLNSVIQSVIEGQDIAGNLIYHSAFRSLKGDVKAFLDYIEDGNYFESFPTVESYILVIDYDELTAALQTLTGTSCTVENAYLRALSKSDWVKYWLQENKGYNVGTNTLGEGNALVTTSPATPTADTVQVTASPNHFDVDITSEITTSDSATIDQRWQINLTTIVYNSGADNYSIPAYQASGLSITLPYTAPSKPLQLHYVSTYYRNAAPTHLYIFIYQVGSGGYTDLDTVEDPIDQDGSSLKALPAVPLRISNSNYTTFGATKRAKIEGILDIIHLQAEEVLNAVLTDSGIASGDLDHIFVNFGVRMWDTSQAGMSYLFNMFQNLFPSQGITQGTYNNTPASDDKPHNNILITCADYEYAFQWSYITYAFTSLATVNANSGSTENGIYYSDLSRFDSSNILKYNYYVSSGKGTYNVGYKADTLTEVAAFLAGNGTVNPGTTTAEAANWLQVTERMSYNNPSPSLLESDNGASTLKFLTADAVYENNGSGVLRYVQQASPETTLGQSITYYCCKPSGLDAYTVHAPIGALRVVDGDSGKFKTVKFNLGAKADLMAPFIHNFIKDLPNQQVSRLFLSGAHVSIYIAHYEVIVHAGMSFLTALVMIIIIVVIAVVAWPMLKAGFIAMKATFATLLASVGTGTFLATAWGLFVAAIPNILIKMAAQYIIQVAITEIAGDNEELAMMLNLISMVAITAWDPGVGYGGPTYGHTGGTAIGPDVAGSSIEFASPSFTFSGSSFDISSLLDPSKIAQFAMKIMSGLTEISLRKEQDISQQIAAESEAFSTKAGELYAELNVLKAAITPSNAMATQQIVQSVRSMNRGAALGGEVTYALFTAQYDVPYTAYAYSESIEQSVGGGGMYT